MMFRKWLAVILLLALSVSAQGYLVHAQTARHISIFLDGQQVNSDVSPYIIPKVNVTMVPLRVISESLGAEVTWSQSTQTAVISKPGTTIAMTIGKNYALVNGNSLTLDAGVENRQSRVMVPLRFVSEQLGLQVTWEQSTQTIFLQSGTDPVLVPPQVDTGTENNGSLRGVWVSTVFNLDWPTSGSYGNIEKQQQEYVALLDDLQAIGMNAVFVQVRPAADSLYPSQMVPWSKFLTGTQGQDPGYDPLAFMIAETHKRGMEFHAWFNPFRAHTDASTDNLAENHVAKVHPDWIVKTADKLYINPGIPQARQQIIDEIMEVVTLYDIDGVHLDDYFYPSNTVFADDAAFQAYNSKQFATKADWRRDNINEFVQKLGESIHNAKPDLQFGISPFGVWRNNSVDVTGSDTRAGVTAYDNMYADVRTWIKQEWIDYVIPQIYWSLSYPSARYDKLVDWWANEVNGTDVTLYVGHALYKLGSSEAGWQTSQEIINQLQYNAQYPQVKGDLFFSAKHLRNNPLGIVEALRSHYSRTW